MLLVNKMFNNYLKVKRLSAGLSQQKLADKITSLGYKVSNGKISYYETDYGKKKKGWTNRPPEDFLEYLALALDLDLNEARKEAGYATEELPKFVYEIDFSVFDENDLAEIENFIKFKANQKGERYIIHRTHTHGTIRADDKAA